MQTETGRFVCVDDIRRIVFILYEYAFEVRNEIKVERMLVAVLVETQLTLFRVCKIRPAVDNERDSSVRGFSILAQTKRLADSGDIRVNGVRICCDRQ